MTRTALVVALVASVLAASADAMSFNGVGQVGEIGGDAPSTGGGAAAPSSAFTFNILNPAEQGSSFNSGAKKTPSTPTLTPIQSSTPTPTQLLPPPAPTLMPTTTMMPDQPCEWEGFSVRHQSAKYFVGGAHRRGSIFGECANGKLSCYEDSGLADASAAQHHQIACDATAFPMRQRELDLEDRGVAPATTNSSNSKAP